MAKENKKAVMGTQAYKEFLMNSVNKKYIFSDNLLQANEFLSKNIFIPILHSMKADAGSIHFIALPTFAANPQTIMAPNGDTIILFDHVLLSAIQFYFRAIFIHGQLDMAKASVYLTRVYDALLNIYKGTDVNFHEVENILGIDIPCDDTINSYFTICSLCVDYFIIVHELMHILNNHHNTCEIKSVKIKSLNNVTIEVCQYTHEQEFEADIKGLKWFKNNIKSQSLISSIGKPDAIRFAFHIFIFLSFIEKNLPDINLLSDYPCVETRLEKIINSINKITEYEMRKNVIGIKELAQTVPVPGSLQLSNMLFDAILRS